MLLPEINHTTGITWSCKILNRKQENHLSFSTKQKGSYVQLRLQHMREVTSVQLAEDGDGMREVTSVHLLNEYKIIMS